MGKQGFSMFGQNKLTIRHIDRADADWALVVGDVHGKINQLEQLYALYREHTPADAKRCVISVGDLIDRGENSAAVIDWFLNSTSDEERLCVRGNHEVMFKSFLERPNGADRWFQDFGGRETLRSYAPDLPADAAIKDIRRAVRQVPDNHRAFLKEMADVVIFDDLCVVHAAIDPRRPLEKQSREKLHWGPCLDWNLAHLVDLSPFPFSHVVHGHEPHGRPIDPQRPAINLDTGCYKTGTLTGLILNANGSSVISTTL